MTSFPRGTYKADRCHIHGRDGDEPREHSCTPRTKPPAAESQLLGAGINDTKTSESGALGFWGDHITVPQTSCAQVLIPGNVEGFFCNIREQHPQCSANDPGRLDATENVPDTQSADGMVS